MLKFIKNQRKIHPKLCEIIRFLIIGGIATLLDMLVMALIIYLPNHELFDNNFINVFLDNSKASSTIVIIATALGFVSGLVFNYIFSILYVYLGENTYAKTKKGFLIFASLSLIGLCIQTLGMYVGYTLLKFNEWIVKIILVFVVLIFNYITRKIFIFNKTNNAEKNE